MRAYHSTETYISLVTKAHKGEYSYEKTVFVRMKDKIVVTCKTHGDFYPSALNHKTTGCPACYESRRGATLEMSEKDFIDRLKPPYTLAGPFTNASTKVNLTCGIHGSFTGVPTRVLMRPSPCKGCEMDKVLAANEVKRQVKIKDTLKKLPQIITCTDSAPTWAKKVEMNCEVHGPFKTILKNIGKYTFVCNECAKESLKGTCRTSYTEYEKFLNNLFPNPPVPVKLDKKSYEENAGTKTVAFICKEHGLFTRNRSTVNNGRLQTPCPSCKKNNVSTPELEVLEYVRQFVRAEQGNRTLIRPKEIDILVPSKNLAVEFCGLYWHSEAKVYKNYHLDKLLKCRDKGYGLIHIFEDEWANKREICKSILNNRLGVNSLTYYARKLHLIESCYKELKPFFETNHIQGGIPSQKYLALLDSEGGIKAAACFSYNRLKKDKQWELVRYCSALNTNVVGGLSKLCKNFMKKNKVNKIISYCCLRWFNGRGYEAAGFKNLGVRPISYFYTNKQERYSRYVCQKSKLSKLIPNFNPELTETENMEKAGYLKIYDCGNLLFELTLPTSTQ